MDIDATRRFWSGLKENTCFLAAGQSSNGRRQASLSDSVSKTSAKRRKSTPVSDVIDLSAGECQGNVQAHTHQRGEIALCNTRTVNTHTQVHTWTVNTCAYRHTRTHTHTPGEGFSLCLQVNRGDVAPNGTSFPPLGFLSSSRAQRGSLYMPTGGDNSFTSHGNLWQREIKGNKEDKCWIMSRKRMFKQEKERERREKRRPAESLAPH